jgi:DNA mismatch repair protein MutS
MSDPVATRSSSLAEDVVEADGAEWRAGRLLSLLYPGPVPEELPGRVEQPACFRDLNLDQMIAALAISGEAAEQVLAAFHLIPAKADVVAYRQEIFRDLEDPFLRAAMQSFKDRIDEVRRHLVSLERRSDPREIQAWFLDAALIYCQAVIDLDDALGSGLLRSAGLTACREVISHYRNGAAFGELLTEARTTRAALDRITYCIRVRGGSVEVSRYQYQADYSQEIEETFARFRQGAVKDYRVVYRLSPHLGHVGSKVLEFLSRLYPEEFAGLDQFCQRHSQFRTHQISQLDVELGFYLAYLGYIEPIRSSGLAFCYPQVGDDWHAVKAEDTFDIVLARKLVGEGTPVVSNTFRLEGAERIFVISGPNQGGKTTLARTFGQLHYLAVLGCPVPGTAGKFGMFDRIFTHFQREERLADLRGKLEDDLVRMRTILEEATDRSLIILNEVFASTTLDDARFLGRKVMHRLLARGVRAVYVTFVDELSNMGPQVVSMVSTVVPEDPARRTFRVIRAPANGLAYAMAIAEKYGLTYERLIKDLGR